MKDAKLLAIAMFIFLVLPLSAKIVTPHHYATQLKIKPLKEQPKLEACTAWIIPLVWRIHYQCAADAYGGGGGRAF